MKIYKKVTKTVKSVKFLLKKKTVYCIIYKRHIASINLGGYRFCMPYSKEMESLAVKLNTKYLESFVAKEDIDAISGEVASAV